jgi:hypothetical protein
MTKEEEIHEALGMHKWIIPFYSYGDVFVFYTPEEIGEKSWSWKVCVVCGKTEFNGKLDFDDISPLSVESVAKRALEYWKKKNARN